MFPTTTIFVVWSISGQFNKQYSLKRSLESTTMYSFNMNFINICMKLRNDAC